MLNKRKQQDENDNLHIGERLRAIREGRGLSQRELARRAGVTNGMISLIEQGKTSPSVASLKKVLEGIPISLAEFFADEPPAKERVFFRASELATLAEGAISFRQIGDNLAGRRLQILHEFYEPGADTGKAMLRHDSEEGGVIVRGAIEITAGEHRRTLKAGDAYYFDSRLPHRFRNVGKEQCEIISACSPPSF